METAGGINFFFVTRACKNNDRRRDGDRGGRRSRAAFIIVTYFRDSACIRAHRAHVHFLDGRDGHEDARARLAVNFHAADCSRPQRFLRRRYPPSTPTPAHHPPPTRSSTALTYTRRLFRRCTFTILDSLAYVDAIASLINYDQIRIRIIFIVIWVPNVSGGSTNPTECAITAFECKHFKIIYFVIINFVDRVLSETRYFVYIHVRYDYNIICLNERLRETRLASGQRPNTLRGGVNDDNNNDNNKRSSVWKLRTRAYCDIFGKPFVFIIPYCS